LCLGLVDLEGSRLQRGMTDDQTDQVGSNQLMAILEAVVHEFDMLIVTGQFPTLGDWSGPETQISCRECVTAPQKPRPGFPPW
jgi:hypothetical protein